ncbi:MAG: hypothetical protein Q9211_000637 [Gyalolechia sp. 1 TL-2023]
MDNVLFYLAPTNELARWVVQSASNRSLHYSGIRGGLVLRISLPEPNSLRQSPEKTDFLSFGTQPDNCVVLPGLVAAPYHCYLWLRRQGLSWMLTDNSSQGTRVFDAIQPNIGETISRGTRAVDHLTSLQVAGCAFVLRFPVSDEGGANVWTRHLDNSPVLSTTDDPHTGLRMPEYHVEPNLLGSGSQGRVLKVIRKRTGFHYAVKEITIPAESHKVLKQQEREIQYMKTLRHDGILNLLAFSVERAPEHFIVRILMPFCKTSLEKIIPDERIFYDFMRQGCAAMGFLHSHGIIHRDIKPLNILVLEGQSRRYVLTDFGYANKVQEATTICGTPGYMAPELVFGGPYDAKSDVFSMGVVGLEIRGIFQGMKDEVGELPKGWIAYQGGLQVAKRISQVNAALVTGDLLDQEGWYRLLSAMTQQDPKARPTAAEALDFLTSHAPASSTTGITARFESLAERQSEAPPAHLDTSKGPAQPLRIENRHLACAPAPTAPRGSIPIHRNMMTRPLRVTKPIHGPGFRTPVPTFRPRPNDLRQALQTNNQLARLITSPYSQHQPEAATTPGLLKPADDGVLLNLDAPGPEPDKGNSGRCEGSDAKTSTRAETAVPACLTAQHSRLDRSKVVKRKHRGRQRIPGAWCADLNNPEWVFPRYSGGMANWVKGILAFLGVR